MKSTDPGAQQRWLGTKTTAFLIATVAAIALSIGIGSRGLMEPSEGRYASIASAMERSGDLVVPRINGHEHLEKPPISMWAMAGSMELFGESEAALRLPGVVFALMAVMLAYLFVLNGPGSKSERTRQGLLASGLALSAPLLFGMARVVTTDIYLAGWVALSQYFALRALKLDRLDTQAKRWFSLSMLASALGFLTKGPVVLIFTLLPILIEALWSRRFRQLRVLFHPLNLILFAAVVLPWFIALNLRLPGSLHWLVFERAVGAAVSSKSFHPGPFYYFVPVFLIGILPAGPILASAGRQGLRELFDDRGHRLLVCAVVVPFFVLSLSASKLGTYLLPMVVPVSVLASATLIRGRAKWGLFAASTLVLLVALAGLVMAWRSELVVLAGRTGLLLATIAGLVALIGGFLSARSALARRTEFAARVLIGSQLAALCLLVPLSSPCDELLSTLGTGKHLARQISEHATPGQPVVCYQTLVSGLPYYLGRNVYTAQLTKPITGITPSAQTVELSSFLAQQPTLVVTRTRNLEQLKVEVGELHTLWQGEHFTLLSNAP